MEKKKVLCIIGHSGSGKTTIEELLVKTFPMHFQRVVSYTTRPKREGETNGWEHYFVGKDQAPTNKDVLAYTKYGEYEYWALPDDLVTGRINTYVIDVEGYKYLQQFYGDKLEIRVMYVKRTNRKNIDQDRADRDRGRMQLQPDEIDMVLRNEGGISDLIANVQNNIFDYIMSIFNENTVVRQSNE